MGKRVMIDSNIWISGLLFFGNELELLYILIFGQSEIVTCRSVLLEVNNAMRSKFGMTEIKAEAIWNLMNEVTEQIPEREMVDPFDDDELRILDAAIRSDCDYFVTGDKTILNWGSFGKLQVVRTVEMLKMIELRQ
jgi:putative PIN family toxin of toxin-antitoxin system